MLNRHRQFGKRLNKFFDRIYCINLDNRPDRWRYVNKHFSRFGLKRAVKRFSAIDVRTDPDWIRHEKLLKDNYSRLAMCGCLLSHRKIIASARQKGLKNVLVFEDDVKFLHENIATLHLSLSDLSSLDWDVFYLGATYMWELLPIGSYLVNVPHGAFATHAIAYNHSIYDQILDSLPSEPLEYLETDRFEINALDEWLKSDLFDHRKFFGTNPIMAVQGLEESDISFDQPDNIEAMQIDKFRTNLKD